MPHHDPIPERRAQPSDGRAPPPDESLDGQGIANRHAWARYRRIMAWMTVLALVCVAATLAYLRLATGSLPLQMAIASAAGVFVTVMVGTGLMSLVFLSAGTGHDADVTDPFGADPPDRRRR